MSGSIWKSIWSSCFLNLVIGCATLGKNSCNQAFAISGNLSLSHHCGGILAQSSLGTCFNAASLDGLWAWTACLKSCYSISVGFTVSHFSVTNQDRGKYFFANTYFYYVLIRKIIVAQSIKWVQSGRQCSFLIRLSFLTTHREELVFNGGWVGDRVE